MSQVNTQNSQDSVKLDKRLMISSLILVLSIAGPLVLFADTDGIKEFVEYVYHITSNTFGWGYILVYLVFGFFAFYVAFSPYGKIKLGGEKQKVAFGTFHWASMIIAAGHGIGLVNWCMVEPLIINAAQPLGTGYNAAYTYEVSTAYMFFHWGPYYWVLYLVACVPIFYFLGVRLSGRQRASSTLGPLVGEKNVKGWLGTAFDAFIILSLAGGIGASLTSAVQLVGGLFGNFFGFENSKTLQIFILAFFTLFTCISLMRPLSKGMRILSDANSCLALFLLGIVLFGGPTSYFFSLGTNTLGMVLDIFPRISGWTDPFNASGFPQEWTVFYGAWFVAYAPMMAIFFTGISMGRTLRQAILGVYFFGCLSSFLFTIILGGFVLYMQKNGVDLHAYYINSGKDLPATVSHVLSLVPYGKFVGPAFLVMVTIFLTTTIDAATRVVASMTTRGIFAGQEPSVFAKIIWCLALAFLVLGLLLVGGLSVIQALVVLTALPLLVLCIFMNFSTYKAIREDFPTIHIKNLLFYKGKDERPVEELESKN